jgi:hypothetical protein
MNDDELDATLDRARRHWRMPPDPPVDAMWDVVASTLFRPRHSRRPGWTTVGLAAAAALIVGAMGGRYLARARVATAPIAAAPSMLPTTTPALTVTNAADAHAMSDLLDHTALLLARLPVDSGVHALDPQITRESARLLTRTRLLLDAPVADNLQLRNLLEDLELVLAQVTRIEPQHPHSDMQFIQTTLHEHNLVPRLRSAAADLSHDDL